MNTISVKLTFADDEFYDWFVEPHKVNGELPNLVIRLLTAYANNSELAYQIDQYLDKDTEPEAFEAREAIMQAIMQLNSLEATASQELEALDDDNQGLDDQNTSEDDDVIITTGTTYTPESVSQSLGSMIGLQSASNPANQNTAEASQASNPSQQGTPEPSQVSNPARQGTSQASSPDFESKVFTALDTLTTQISQLTGAVTQIVMNVPQMGYAPPISNAPLSASATAPVPEPVPEPVSAMLNPSETPVSATANAPVITISSVTPQNAPNSSLSTVGSETIPPNPNPLLKRNSDGSTAKSEIVENPVENVENNVENSVENNAKPQTEGITAPDAITSIQAEGTTAPDAGTDAQTDDDDDYSVPDFMADMIASCL